MASTTHPLHAATRRHGRCNAIRLRQWRPPDKHHVKSSFPTFLDTKLDMRAVLEQLESSVVVLDPAGTMLWANPSWKRNAVPDGLVPSFSETSAVYYGGVPPRLRDFYASVFGSALTTGRVFEQIYGSSSTTSRCVVHCRVRPIDRKWMIVEHRRVAGVDPDLLTDEAWTRKCVVTDGILLQCSYCSRVRGPTPHAWDWMSPWAARSTGRTSHVICALCEQRFWRTRRLASPSR